MQKLSLIKRLENLEKFRLDTSPYISMIYSLSNGQYEMRSDFANGNGTYLKSTYMKGTIDQLKARNKAPILIVDDLEQ